MALAETPRTVKAAVRFFLAFCCLVLALPAFGSIPQQGSQEGPFGLSCDEWLKPGIVVERVKQGKSREPGGLEEGDVLLSWSDGVTGSAFTTPMELPRITYEQWTTLRRVIIHGWRGKEKRVWQLSRPVWRVDVRPNFSKCLLEPYLEAKDLATKGKAAEAAARWLHLGRNAAIPIRWLRAWLISRAGKALFEAKDWEQADHAYKTAVEELDPSDITGVFWIWSRATTLSREGNLKAADDRYEEAGIRIAAADLGAMPLAATNLLFRYQVAMHIGDLERAEAYASEARQIQQRIQPNDEFYLWALGCVEVHRGDIAKAEGYYRQLLLGAKRSRSAFGRLTGWWGLSIVTRERGDLDRADKYIAMAQRIAERNSDTNLGQIYEIHGMIARDRGKFDAAEAYFRKGLENALQGSDSFRVASDYNHLGVLYELEGDLDQAESYLREALEICLKKLPNTLELGWIQSDLADTLQKRGDLEQAESYYREALAKFREVAPGSKGHAEVLGALAGLMRRTNRWEDAAAFYDQTLAILENQTAKLLGGSGEARAGFLAKHENYYREYIDLLLLQHKPELALDVLERSRARTLLETLVAAHVDIREAADPGLSAQKHSLQANIKAKSERRISLLGGEHNDEQIKILEKEISDLTAEYQDIEGQIRSKSPSYAALTQPQPLSAKEIQQQLLDVDTALLEYSLGEERSYLFVVTTDSLHAFELPKRAQVEQAARRAYKLLTAAKRSSVTRAQKQARTRPAHRLQPALDELSRMILRPVALQVAGKRLLIVADGALHYIPFQALPEPRTPAGPEAQPPTPLVVEHEIINLPSASVLAVLRQQQMNRPAAPKAVAVLADPVFAKDDPRLLHRDPKSASDGPSLMRSAKSARSRDNQLDSSFSTGALTRSAAEVGLTRGNRLELPRLRFSRQEANAILAVTPPSLGLKALDFRASRASATSPELSQYRIVHFATHGLLNSEHPELSGLVLSLVDAQGRPQEGFLELQDIYNLNLHADLVVLSACETGLGKEISGEGLVGLTRGFMYAGASRVVASLWKVSDAATAQLMAEFYRAMEKDGLAPAAALRQAQVEMWKQPRWRSPYYWAAFQLQGEWK